MEINQINEILKNVFTNNLRKNYTRVEDKNVENDDGYKRTQIWDINLDGLFVKIEWTSDSYNENEMISDIQFVEPKIKTITDYESI